MTASHGATAAAWATCMLPHIAVIDSRLLLNQTKSKGRMYFSHFCCFSSSPSVFLSSFTGCSTDWLLSPNQSEHIFLRVKFWHMNTFQCNRRWHSYCSVRIADLTGKLISRCRLGSCANTFAECGDVFIRGGGCWDHHVGHDIFGREQQKS